MQQILVPVSVSNSRFSTALLESALTRICQRFHYVTFFLADKLYLYNKVREVIGGEQLANALFDYRNRNSETQDRRRWLAKLDERVLRPAGIQSRVLTIDDVSDVRLVNIIRNVVLAYNTIPSFEQDVLQAAKYFYHSHGLDSPTKKQLRLSAAYILEEIGLNIRIRVLDSIGYEYYAGDYVQPLLNIYSGKYSISVQELAEVDRSQARFVFLHQLGELDL